jgi:hypothetical protein
VAEGAAQVHEGRLAPLLLDGREVGLGHRRAPVGVQAGGVGARRVAAGRRVALGVERPAETAGSTTTSSASGQAIGAPGAANAVATTGTPARASSAR